MDYCGPKGIALDDFLSWSEESQQAALQWQAWESRRCANCHTHAEDWDAKSGGSKDHQHWHPQICIGCQKKEQAQAALAKDQDKTRGLGLVAVDGPSAKCPVCHPEVRS